MGWDIIIIIMLQHVGVVQMEGELRDKVFLQALLSRGALQEEQMLELHRESASICDSEGKAVVAGKGKDDTIEDFFSSLNSYS